MESKSCRPRVGHAVRLRAAWEAPAPKPQLQVHPHPTPALNRDSSVQVTSMTSSQSRSATQGGFLCSSAGDADPSS